MLNSVRLRNFKLHEDTKIHPTRVTVFIGPNNSGKSSIFQALLLLRQAANRRPGTPALTQPAFRPDPSQYQPYLFPPDTIVDLGEFSDIVRHGSTELQIATEGTVPELPDLPEGSAAAVKFHVQVRNNTLVSHTGELAAAQGEFSWRFEATSGGPASLTPAQRGIAPGVEFRFDPQADFRLIAGSAQGAAAPVAPQVFARYHALAAALGNAPVRLLNSLRPIFPLRGFEEWGEPLPDLPGRNLDRLTLVDRAVALSSTLAYDRDLEDTVSGRLEELLNIRIKVRLLPGKRVALWVTAGGQNGESLLANQGTGANQLPFILVPLALASPSETILLCEPEAHLHPALQSSLVAMLLKFRESQDLQLLVETHSEHVLHGLLHAVGAGDLRPDDLAIYYFQNVDGTAKVERLEVNQYGQVKGGLPGFFDQSLTELSNYLDALRKA